jgi:hypothetical protein
MFEVNGAPLSPGAVTGSFTDPSEHGKRSTKSALP